MARFLFWLAIALSAAVLVGSALFDINPSGPCADRACLEDR